MFSVVGLIGMVGIIVNDSIVLVTTIDDYAGKRGLLPAIVDGTADRLRPVLLTTLTTVLGLAPLLFEGSEQAQFLKPTVITLVYGLGFGMVLVLLVVPALLAVQHDIHAHVASTRRAMSAPRRVGGAGVATVVLAGLTAVWFAATLGSQIVTGSVIGPIADVLPDGGAGTGVAFGLFAAGALVLLAVVWSVAALTERSRRKAA
jgi:predicted RND superfamily exporter protein